MELEAAVRLIWFCLSLRMLSLFIPLAETHWENVNVYISVISQKLDFVIKQSTLDLKACTNISLFNKTYKDKIIRDVKWAGRLRNFIHLFYFQSLFLVADDDVRVS